LCCSPAPSLFQAHVTGSAQQALSWQDVEGRTALHVAAHRNLLRHVELLLAAGGDVHLNTATRATSGTPLHDAVHGKHDLMVDLLLRHGANPFVENLAGKTPYDLAVDSGEGGGARREGGGRTGQDRAGQHGTGQHSTAQHSTAQHRVWYEAQHRTCKAIHAIRQEVHHVPGRA
jgi:ankyrin repeat protein